MIEDREDRDVDEATALKLREDRPLYPSDPELARLRAIEATASDLGGAWAAVEAVLPEGWSILVGDSRRNGTPGYWATASQPFQEDIRGYRIVSTTDGRPPDETPAAALRFLADRLLSEVPSDAR